MKRAVIAMAAAAALLPFAAPSAEAVSSQSASQICVKAVARAHGDLQGNVQVRQVKHHGAGYAVYLQVKGAEVNCLVTSGGKVGYMN